MTINLADLTPQEEVAAIYIGYYDRAADPFGYSFWTQSAYQGILANVQSEAEFSGLTQVEQEEEVLARIAQDFSTQPESRAEYPFFTTPSQATSTGFLSSVYMNLFERGPDQEGIDFWTPLLLDAVNNPSTAAFSVGEIILEIIKGAQEPDRSVVLNKIEVAQDWTANAATNGVGTTATNFVVQDKTTGQFDIIDQEAYDSAMGVLDGVDDTQNSVDDAKDETQDFFDGLNEPVETTLELGSDDLAPGGVYEADVVILNLDEVPPSSMTVNAGLVIIKAQNETGPNPLTVDVSNWNVDEITVEDSEVDVIVDDIQGTDLNVEDDSDNPDGTTTFDFDKQAVEGDTEIGLGINEVFGSVVIQSDDLGAGEAIETVNLSINDPEGIESEMDSLQVQGIETLNIDGGNEGAAFTIKGPLDAGLMVLDGSGADADLNLNLSDSTEAVMAAGGSGDDTFDMGNTLGGGSAQDTVMGGEGEDVLMATFTDTGNRKPVSTEFEKFVLDFQDNAQLDLEDVDDLETIEVANVANGVGVEIQDADSTVTDLLITGETGGAGGSNDWEFGYDDVVDDQTDQDDLTVTWQNNTSETQFISEFFVDRAESVTFLFDGQQEMVIDDDFDLGFDTNDGDDEEVTEHLVIRNLNDGDGFINTAGGMQETDRLETLTIETTDAGDLDLDGGGDFIDDAAQLEEISITASVNGSIQVGNIGDDEEAVELRNINIMSAGADIDVGRIEGDDEANNDGASVEEVNIFADDGADIYIDEIEVEDIRTMTVVIEDDADVTLGQTNDDGLDLDEQGGTLTVSGDGTFGDLHFEDEAFETMDFTGLTENSVTLNFEDATVGSTVEGTEQDDDIEAGEGDDVLNGNGGDDYIFGDEGNDIINGGAGNDELIGWSGNDTIDGGAGNDYIDGGWNDPSAPFGDILTGGAGNDTFFFDLDSGPDDTGKSTNNANDGEPGQDVITDFTPGADTIVIEGNGNQAFNIAVFNGDGFGTLGDAEFFGDGFAVTKVVIRVGDYNEDGTFNFNSNGEDLQVLFDDDGGPFGDGYFNAAELLSGAQAFNVAEYEIGLTGAANKLGSLDASDFIFN